LGEVYNALGCYFFVRSVVLDSEDIMMGVRTLAWACLPLAFCMLIEKLTTHNLFHVFGGVGDLSEVRDGHLRAQGAFRHPILAGTFGATQIPLFAVLWTQGGKWRWLAGAGCVAACVIVVAASSGGALMAMLVALIGVPLWLWRKHLRLLRRGALVGIVVMAVMMNAPIWNLFDRLSSLTGGTGWYRSYLIGQAVSHFNEWWLFGTTYTAHWVPWGDLPLPGQPNMADITNHYIMEGVKGGIWKLALFVLIIVRSYRLLGRRLQSEGQEDTGAFLAWSLGVAMFAHCLSFTSVHYFDQTILMWYWLLAGCTAVLASAQAHEPLQQPISEPGTEPDVSCALDQDS
jgi:hypothetical protein